MPLLSLPQLSVWPWSVEQLLQPKFLLFKEQTLHLYLAVVLGSCISLVPASLQIPEEDEILDVTTCVSNCETLQGTFSFPKNRVSIKQVFFVLCKRELYQHYQPWVRSHLMFGWLQAWCAPNPPRVYTSNKHTGHLHDYFQPCIIFRRNSKAQQNSNLTHMVIICNKTVTSGISSAAKSLAWLEVFHLEL